MTGPAARGIDFVNLTGIELIISREVTDECQPVDCEQNGVDGHHLLVRHGVAVSLNSWFEGLDDLESYTLTLGSNRRQTLYNLPVVSTGTLLHLPVSLCGLHSNSAYILTLGPIGRIGTMHLLT